MKLRHYVTALLVAGSLSGCAWVETMMNRQAAPDTRTQLEPHQHMDFRKISRRNAQGRHIDEFKCPAKHTMVCEGFGSLWDCSCETQLVIQ